MLTPRTLSAVAGLALFAGGFGIACSSESGGTTSAATSSRTMTRAATPGFDLAAQPKEIQDRYRFVERNQALASRIPCYCNCGGLGHRSLRDCFINAQGGYDSHGANCGVCLSEAFEIEVMALQGMDVKSIRAAIDARYGGVGKPTNTPY
jgi:hypothetical protein